MIEVDDEDFSAVVRLKAFRHCIVFWSRWFYSDYVLVKTAAAE